MKKLHDLEQKIQDIYNRILVPHCQAFAIREPEHKNSAKGTPSVLFLGNHSSGKSSFINHLLGEDIQKTGVAPVDDGFTVVLYGDEKDEFDGHAMASHEQLPYEGLESFGEEFLTRAKLKIRPSEWLKNVTLIDSPGMIDSPESSVSRGYDFAKSVQFFAEHADLILFFFDPDKPGTTGETMDIFKKSLIGKEHKLLILLNKVDAFDNIRDFARTYGALCWNLSKTVTSKDMPHIHVTYLPGMSSASKHHIPLADFDQAREELITEIKRVPVRRLDNLVTELMNQAQRLSMIGRVIDQAAQHYRSLRAKWVMGITLALLAVGGGAWYFFQSGNKQAALEVGGGGFAVVLLLVAFAYLTMNIFKKTCTKRAKMDQFFREAYGNELIQKNRSDLERLWDRLVRDQVVSSITAKGIDEMPRARVARRMINKCEKIIKDTPSMRRTIKRSNHGEGNASDTSKNAGK